MSVYIDQPFSWPASSEKQEISPWHNTHRTSRSTVILAVHDQRVPQHLSPKDLHIQRYEKRKFDDATVIGSVVFRVGWIGGPDH